MDTDFNDFWKAYAPDETRFPHRRAATYRLWCQRSEMAQQAMLTQVTAQPPPKNKNPYFFVLDFPEPEPTNYNGKALPKEPVVIAKWKGTWGTYTLADVRMYQMETRT